MMERLGDIGADWARRAAEQAEHEASCTATECGRCRKFLCREGCGSRVSKATNRCRACADKDLARQWRDVAVRQIPPAHAEASLDAPWLVKLIGDSAIETARGALDAERVAAVGPAGSGKTSLVCAMLAASKFLPKDGAWPRYTSAHQLAKARAFHPLGEGEAPVIARALSAGLLVIDELGGEDQRYASAVAEVIYERHANAMPTWVTTGVGPKEIGDRYGGGISRRIFEGATVFRLGARK